MKKANNKNTENWEQELRGKLYSHVSEPPVGLWESISHDMQMKERPRYVYHKRRWAIIAAMIALVALIGDFVWQKYWDVNGVTNKNVVSVQNAKPRLIASVHQSDTSIFFMERILPVVTNKKHVNSNKKCARNTVADDNPTKNVIDDASVGCIKDVGGKVNANNGTDDVQETSQSHKLSQKLLTDNSSYQTSNDVGKHGGRNHSLNVSLTASGLPSEGASNQNVSVISSDPRTGFFVGSEGVLKEGALQQDVYEHHYPLKVGLSLALQFTDRMAVESGFNYTYLRSTVTKLGSGQNGPVTSSVSYLGVPVSLSYRIWQSGCVSVCSGIGGEVAKSLQGNQWQVSTMLSMRVQYDLNHVCGMYLQPSVDYYFDNHTNVKTYYSEHPLMPSLQVGFRFNVK